MPHAARQRSNLTDMAGYSGTPLAKKLGIRAGNRVCTLGAPASLEAALEPVPPDVTLQTSLRGRAAFDVVLLFAKRQADVASRFAALRDRLTPAGGLWVCWPKKASGVPTDLTDAWVREYGLATGLVDNKVCAVDETWSALRFVIRLRDRT